MARGKYAARATIRKETREATETIDSYRHAVQRLTRERNESREKLETTERALRREIKVLRAQMDSNVAPEVDVLRSELRIMKQKYETDKRKYQQNINKVINMCARALYAHGWGWYDALDFVQTSAVGLVGAVISDDKNIGKVAKTSEEYRRLENILENRNRSKNLREKRPIDDPEWVKKMLESYEDQA